MKFLTVFAAILAIAFGSPSHWTIDQLSEALENPHTNPSLIPILEQAMNTFMASIFAGESHKYISITTAPVDLNTWSLSELSEVVESPNTDPALLPYLENALNTLMNAIFSGEVQAATAHAAITIPAMEISYWTLADLEKALVDPSTSPALLPYLEQAVNIMMENLFSGVQMTSIVLATPLEPAIVTPEVVPGQVIDIPVDPVQVVEAPIDPVQVVDAPIQPPVGPVIVSPVAVESGPAAPAVSGSPLVQIILNINQESAVVPEIISPAPVSVPETDAYPNPRPPAPESVIQPEPVIIAPEINPIDDVQISPPEVNPEPVIIAPEINPIDDIQISPPEVNPVPVIIAPEINPIDDVMIAPPEVNPVDLLNPVIQPSPVAGGAIDNGPM